MGKEIFIPSKEELCEMQEKSVNVYKYLLVKVIEILALEGNKYPNKGIFKTAYKYIREDPSIAHAICMMYPEEVLYSNIAKYDPRLCLKLLENNDESIYNLDNLSLFSDSVNSNNIVAKEVISILAKKLPDNPKYRFEYRPSTLLDEIFNGSYDVNFYAMDSRMVKELVMIEPVYALYLDKRFFGGMDIRDDLLHYGVDIYADRYGIDENIGREYFSRDIINFPNENVKRLIKFMDRYKANSKAIIRK